MRTPRIFPKAFTLIELLIVVAIIAILAAIAIPNFLEAQVRSKVSRVKADMRSLATGLEAYNVDYNAYPKCNNFGYATARYNPAEQGVVQRWVLERLSTPIAYVTSSTFPDPFIAQQRTGTIDSATGSWTPTPTNTDPNAPLDRFLKYYTPGVTGLQDVEAASEKANYYFCLVSAGPDLIYPNMGGLFAATATEVACLNNIYDPTNGTVSSGSVYRVGGTPTGKGNYGGQFFYTVQSAQK